ncbi:MAG: 50S ribosomal protein L6 [Candidatus Woesearchaeota archaeon]
MNQEKKQGKRKESLVEELIIPEGINVFLDDKTVIVKNGSLELKRTFNIKNINFEIENSKLRIKSIGATKREYKNLRTIRAHILNMFKGIKEPFVYKLKVCSSHFPMKITVKGDTFRVENFLGEHHPRELKIKEGVNVKVDGNLIIVESHDKEKAGQVASDIERLTTIKNKDRRIFQDGIFLIERAGKRV